MESMADISRLYTYSHPDKMSMPVAGAPPSPPQSCDADNYGTLHKQYWDLMGNNIEDSQLPNSTTGTYMSPYNAQAISDTGPYYIPMGLTVHDDSMPPLLEDVSHWSSVGGVGSDPLYTHTRTPYGFQDAHHHPYHTPPLDLFPYGDSSISTSSLPALDSCSTHILNHFASGTAQQFMDKLLSPQEASQDGITAAIGLFSSSKRQFLHSNELFIDIPSLQNTYNSVQSSKEARIFRRANLATFVLIAAQRDNIPFIELDKQFLDIFTPPGGRLLKEQSHLWLELKTQAFIQMALMGQNPDLLIAELFPREHTIEASLLQRRDQANSNLSTAETDFVNRMMPNRRSTLISFADKIEQLPQTYDWTSFADKLETCVKSAIDSLKDVASHHHHHHHHLHQNQQHHHHHQSHHHSHSLSSAKVEGLGLYSLPQVQESTLIPATDAALAHLGGHSRSVSMGTMGGHSALSSGSLTSSPFGSSQLSFMDTPSSIASGRSFRSTPSANTTPESLSMHVFGSRMGHHHPTSSPSSKAGARRPNPPSQRRPWTPEEEKALLDGLERVKGPHWSQILALYGAGGSLAETLKDRNQVQLKDKARNLKLFFLKSGVEVPGYLKRVTGELRTRAPGQAAKREKEMRKRKEEEERMRASAAAAAAAGGGSVLGHDAKQVPTALV